MKKYNTKLWGLYKSKNLFWLNFGCSSAFKKYFSISLFHKKRNFINNHLCLLNYAWCSKPRPEALDMAQWRSKKPHVEVLSWDAWSFTLGIQALSWQEAWNLMIRLWALSLWGSRSLMLRLQASSLIKKIYGLKNMLRKLFFQELDIYK